MYRSLEQKVMNITNKFVSQHCDGKVSRCKSLDQLEEQLDPSLFYRVNRQCLAHLEAVSSAVAYDKGKVMVELQPKTGRMHQLRVHMNKISHPLIGDAKYGDKNHDVMFQENFDCKNLFLHAGSLTFIHPFTNKKLHLKASFPKDWLRLFEKFEWVNPLK